MAKLTDRLIHAWNAFNGRDPTYGYNSGPGSSYNPMHSYFMLSGGDRSIASMIINRIAVDASTVSIEHAKLDENSAFVKTMDSGLNKALTLSANLDQTGKAFMIDVVTSMCSEGVVGIVPTDIDSETTGMPQDARAYDILKLRTAKVTEWFPKHVRLEVYNENKGQKEQIVLPKTFVAIVENPFYDVMNRPNSMFQRLIRTLGNLDVLDSQNTSGKLDLIIHLPYPVRNELKRNEADARKAELERQLTNSKYGIAYIDATEKITQLNRSVENNLWAQAKELTDMVFSQFGLTPDIFNGTADEAAMINYHNRTIEPILSAVSDEMKRKFLTDTARTQGQSIVFFRDPFKLVPVSQIADIADKFTRNEILSPNEVRSKIGFKPSKDPKSNELRNRNISESKEEVAEDDALVKKEKENSK